MPKKKFSYTKRSSEAATKRRSSGGGRFDSTYRDDIKVWKPKEGTNAIRICPPTWEDAEHFGFDVWLHSNVGPDEATYPCLKLLFRKKCPCCEEEIAARRAGDSEYAKKLSPYKRVLLWVIDRDNPGEGAQLYPGPQTLDREILQQSFCRKTHETLAIDDPYDGYDVEFSRDGKGLNTRYTGVKIDRYSSPLLDDDDDLSNLLDFLVDNPIPDSVIEYSYEYIKAVFDAAPDVSTEEDDDHSPTRKKPLQNQQENTHEEDEPEERPRRRSAPSNPEPEEEEDEPEDRPRRRRTRPSETKPEGRKSAREILRERRNK